jgi:hypothetical protein
VVVQKIPFALAHFEERPSDKDERAVYPATGKDGGNHGAVVGDLCPVGIKMRGIFP